MDFAELSKMLTARNFICVPGSHADPTGCDTCQLRYLVVGLGFYAFLWTEKDFGKYFVDEEVTYRDSVWEYCQEETAC
ncbi:MAG UNVERIFIED_CONTAM: hypothetical protein LVR29_27630 [Microcystis novacekii LVE1205-3]